MKGFETMINVKEIFHSIQGEGPFAGRPAWFIRLAECPLRCPGCDTDFLNGELWDEEAILKEVSSFRKPNVKKMVVITGGEPLVQDLTRLCKMLLASGYWIQIETSGVSCHEANLEFFQRCAAFISSPMTGVNIVCSPKAAKVVEGLKPFIGWYKYVGRAGKIDVDGLPEVTLKASEKVSGVFRDKDFLNHCPERVFIQPLDEQDADKNYDNLRFCAEVCALSGFSLTVQIHKLLNWR